MIARVFRSHAMEKIDELEVEYISCVDENMSETDKEELLKENVFPLLGLHLTDGTVRITPVQFLIEIRNK